MARVYCHNTRHRYSTTPAVRAIAHRQHLPRYYVGQYIPSLRVRLPVARRSNIVAAMQTQ